MHLGKGQSDSNQGHNAKCYDIKDQLKVKIKRKAEQINHQAKHPVHNRNPYAVAHFIPFGL